MNRQNFVWHAALALMLVAVAAFIGQVRRWQTHTPPPFVEAPRAEFPVHDREVPDAHREARDILVRFSVPAEQAASGAAAPGLDEKLPNDPMLGDQWALINRGLRGGREKADIGAALAWAKTQGSERVVIAVLDSGVDYTHPDLMENMWLRPGDVA